MNQTLTIAKRELTSLFYSPIAYVILALFGFGSTLIFFSRFEPGAPATMRPTFEAITWFMIFLVPAISMRLLSEEFRTGTIEMLMTSPLSDAQLIIGKWLGALGFFAALMVPVAVLVGILEAHGKPDYGPILTGFLGLFLVGGLYLAIGTFASSLTQNQIIAFLITFFFLAIFTIAIYYIAQSDMLTNQMRQAVLYLSINDQFDDFPKGVIDTSHVIFFTTFTGLFLFFSVLSLQSKRWR